MLSSAGGNKTAKKLKAYHDFAAPPGAPSGNAAGAPATSASVRKVNIFGEQGERIYVLFDSARLATLGVSAQTVFDALQRQNLVAPGGALETRGSGAFVRIDRGYDDVQSVEQTPIAAGGSTLLLGDIARWSGALKTRPASLFEMAVNRRSCWAW